MTHHEAGLRGLLEKYLSEDESKNFIEGLKDHRSFTNFSDADKVMLDYAVKLTTNPSEIIENDVIRLKENGFDDGAVHDICTIVAYFNFVNRIANGLGVELESF